MVAKIPGLGDPVLASDRVRPIARESSRRLSRFVGRDIEVKIAGTKEVFTLPAEAVRLLVDLLSQLAQGNAVTVVPYHAELTTQQAADVLGVSRPFLVKQLEAESIPFRKVGTHRRVKFEDLLAFKKSMYAKRLKSLEELSALDQELERQQPRSMATLTVIYDACVLYPATLRSLLMYLAMEDLFRARWTNEIHEEWMRNLLKDRPDIAREKVERTRDLMNAHVLDCLVTGYEPLIQGLVLPDPDDRHVLAAAIKAGAAVIVTYNLADFPADDLKPLGVEAQHPDEFLAHLLNLSAPVVCSAVRQHRQGLKKPPVSVEQLLATLERLQLPQTVGLLRQDADLL